MTQFTDLGLAEPILRALTDEGYETPTPIQCEVIPAMIEGRDVLGIAQTGTGKTAAFTLPILNSILEQDQRPQPKTCRALILSPTRELSAQILENVRGYGRHMRVSSTLIVGGVKPGPQIRALSKGVDVLVATPGRLLDLMESGAVRLNQTTTLILDEADQMLDLGFFPAIRKIVGFLPKKRQTALLSATMPKPIRALAHEMLDDPKQVSVAPASRPIERIEQSVVLLPKESKKDLLLELMSDRAVERAIVFSRTKHGADKINRHLVDFGLKSAAIHGNKSQAQRIKALDGFKTGSVKILVATDIAARGIDVDNVSHVVNHDLPNIPEAYVHRIGRTARAGKSGVAVSMCEPGEYEYLRDIERLTGLDIERVYLGDEDKFLAEAKNATPAASQKKQQRPARKKAFTGGGRPQGQGGGRPRSAGGGQSSGGSHGGGGAKRPRRRNRSGAGSPARA
ncbi:DEAD/DEAH box helicase [uncultured Maricaulis sp.]|uniref:DEAD/DEAH box helicase n=1 Tax=uncultured Maricaulis sp. TaxID=174710 RepID=UPI00262CC94F|nr:DEAD/DEAH box helicase [uncultured Maricaulis sp.]